MISGRARTHSSGEASLKRGQGPGARTTPGSGRVPELVRGLSVTHTSRRVRAGRSRQWLGAVPAARIWVACQSSALRRESGRADHPWQKAFVVK